MLETALKDQLRTIFAPLDSRYTFLIRLNPRHENRNELIELLEDVASCSEKINYRLEEGEGLEMNKKRGSNSGAYRTVTNSLLYYWPSSTATAKGKTYPTGAYRNI